jgi:prephenate dehydrogenase
MPNKPIVDNVAILGVGLIGGSIGLALQKFRLAREVIGIDPNPTNLRIARRLGAITRGTADLARGVVAADLAVVCTPLETIADRVVTVAAKTGGNCLITDAGSTKARIVRQVQRQKGTRFIGSHPMAGSEQKGTAHADAALLAGRTVIITPTRSAAAADIRLIKRFWTSLGAHIVSMTPAEHDRAVASVSHLPHLIAAAVAAATPRGDLPQVAAGWLDTTRIAASDVEMWLNILTDNRTHILKSAERFGKVWTSLCTALERDDRVAMRRILQDAKAKRDTADPQG